MTTGPGLVPPWDIDAEIRTVKKVGLIAFFIVSVIAYAVFGIWCLIAYYGIGAVVGLVKCVQKLDNFTNPWGVLYRRRMLKYGVIVAFLWPFVVLNAAGF